MTSSTLVDCALVSKAYGATTVLDDVSLRVRAGDAGYAGGFIEHYLLPVIYPMGLTPTVQTLLGLAVLAIALVTYGTALRRLREREALARHAARPRRTIPAEDWR